MTDGKQKLLVVEDELFIGIEIEAVLEAEGFDVIGPIGNVTDALAIIEKFDDAVSRPIGAFLDLNLNGKPIDEVAEALGRKNVPIVFLSGYGRAHLPEKFRDKDLIGKPFEARDLTEATKRFLDQI